MLYYVDFMLDIDDEIFCFLLDGEFGVLVNMGNIFVVSVKVGVNVDYEMENWSSLYFVEMLYKESIVDLGEREVIVKCFYGSV